MGWGPSRSCIVLVKYRSMGYGQGALKTKPIGQGIRMPAFFHKQSGQTKWLIFAILSSSYVLVYFHRLVCLCAGCGFNAGSQRRWFADRIARRGLFLPLCDHAVAGRVVIGFLGAAQNDYAVFRRCIFGFGPLGLAPTVSIAIVGRTIVGIGVAMLFVPTLKVLAECLNPPNSPR